MVSRFAKGWVDVSEQVQPEETKQRFVKGWNYDQEEDQGQTEDSALSALGSGAKRLASAGKTLFNVLTGDEQEARESAAKGAQIPVTESEKRFQQAYADRQQGDEGVWGTVKDLVGAAWEEPKGAFHSFTGQAPNSIPGLAGIIGGAKVGATAGTALTGGTPVGGVVGGIIGGLLGGAVADVGVETGYIAQDELNQPGSSFNQKDILEKGTKKGLSIAAADAVGMALTGGAGRLVFGPAARASNRAISKFLVDKGLDQIGRAHV